MCPSLGDLEADNAWCLVSSARRHVLQHDGVLLVLSVHGLQGFGDTSKVSLLVFLELWLETYPLNCGSG